jgi:hypothetical protein
VRRCRRRDVDVDAVLLGTNKARKNRNPNTHVNSQKFGAKRTHKVVKTYVKITLDFVSKCQLDVKRSIMVSSGDKMVSKVCIKVRPK